MMWRQPRDAARRSEYVAFPWKSPASEGEIRKALTAQYCSTYACNFMGMPRGTTCVLSQSCVHECRKTCWYVQITSSACSPFVPKLFLSGCDDFNKAERWLACPHNRRHVPLSNNTEMRANYRQLKQKPELQGNLSHYTTDPNVTSCGIGTV